MFTRIFEIIGLNIVHVSGIFLFSLEGLLLAAIGFKLFQFLIPLKPYGEMNDRERLGVSVIIAGLVIGMSIIIAETSYKKPPVVIKLPTYLADYYRSVYAGDNTQVPKNRAMAGGCGQAPRSRPEKKAAPDKSPAAGQRPSAARKNRLSDENIWLNNNP